MGSKSSSSSSSTTTTTTTTTNLNVQGSGNGTVFGLSRVTGDVNVETLDADLARDISTAALGYYAELADTTGGLITDVVDSSHDLVGKALTSNAKLATDALVSNQEVSLGAMRFMDEFSRSDDAANTATAIKYGTVAMLGLAIAVVMIERGK